ncbi:MAG: hypothetical protein U5K54_24920 [Cytophagales bacterium]|nr:hypothetical protein [Cytophagales bacterium]
MSATICSGSTVAVSLTGTETGINYQLYDGPSPLSPVVAGTGGVINITTTPLIANITISVLATNPVTGCTILLGGTTTVTLSAIIPTPTIAPPGRCWLFVLAIRLLFLPVVQQAVFNGIKMEYQF